MEDRAGEIEREVAKREAEIAALEEELGHFVSVEETVRLTKLAEQRRTEIEALMKEWEQVSAAIEANR